MTLFTPPTYRVVQPTTRTGGPRFGIDQGVSIVRINGVLRTVQRPSPAQLRDAGQEGIDWFIGGHIYNVDAQVAGELEAAGFDVSPAGFGEGGFGLGPFGG